MSIEEIKSRLRKIKALAESGFGGEREAAEALLSRMMNEYGISIDELDDEAIQEFSVGKLLKWERVLWNQLVSLAAFGKPRYGEKGLYTSRYKKYQVSDAHAESLLRPPPLLLYSEGTIRGSSITS